VATAGSTNLSSNTYVNSQGRIHGRFWGSTPSFRKNIQKFQKYSKVQIQKDSNKNSHDSNQPPPSFKFLDMSLLIVFRWIQTFHMIRFPFEPYKGML